MELKEGGSVKQMKTLVIGLGNPFLKDDGIGIHVAAVVAKKLPQDAHVDVVELSVGGLTLMEAMIGYELVIILDAIWSAGGAVGEVVEFTAGDQRSTMNSVSAHDVDLATALQLGRQLGAALPGDESIQIIGVTAHEVLDFGDSPTPRVLAAVPQAARRVLELLGFSITTDATGIAAIDDHSSHSNSWRQ